MRTLQLCLLAACLAAPGGARAGDAEDMARAQLRIDEASARFRAGDYRAALDSLRAAEGFAVMANDPGLAGVRFNIARCLEELGQHDEALAAYEAYQRMPDEPHRKQRAWSAIQALARKVFGQLSVSCSPPGASVAIEGLTRGPQSCPWSGDRVRPGRYAATVTLAGHRPATRAAKVEAGRGATLQIELEPEARAVASAAPGVTAERAPPAESGGSVLPWIALGTGVAAIGAGVLLARSAIGERERAEDMPPSSARGDAVDAFETRRNLGYGLYGFGGVALAAGVALFFLTGDEAPATGAAVGCPLGMAFTW